MRARLLAILMALSLPAVATSALAQDMGEGAAAEGVSPEPVAPAGDMAATPPPATEMAPATADSSGAKKPISVGLLLGYGISLEKGSNPWGLGFGLRGGYNIDKIFLGVRFVYYLGASQSAAGVKTSENIWELGIEGGYDVDLASSLVLRPELGLGLASINISFSGVPGFNGASASGSSSKLYLAPGAALVYDVSENIFIGLDTRFQIVLASPTAKSLIFLANGGMRF